MRLFTKENLLVYRTTLKGDIEYLQYFDMDYMDRGRVERVMEFVRLGRKGEPLPLVKPLLVISLPRTRGITKRELGNFVDGEVRRNRAYLDRVGERIAKALETYILTGEIYYKPRDDPEKDSGFVWTRVPKRTKFWLDLLFGDDEDGKEDDDKPP